MSSKGTFTVKTATKLLAGVLSSSVLPFSQIQASNMPVSAKTSYVSKTKSEDNNGFENLDINTICKSQKTCYNLLNHSTEVDVMTNVSPVFENRVVPVTPYITLNVNSEDEFKKMFEPVKVEHDDEYAEQMRKLFGVSVKKGEINGRVIKD